MISIILINGLVVLIYPLINDINWPVNVVWIYIVLHLAFSWAALLIYLSRRDEYKGQRLTKELIEELREQDRLDKESVFDQTYQNQQP